MDNVYLFEVSLGLYQRMDDTNRDTAEGCKGNTPSNGQGPTRVLVISITHRFIANELEHHDDQNECRGQCDPTHNQNDVRGRAYHLLHVTSQSFSAVEPGDGRDFEDRNEEKGDNGVVPVKQLEHVHTSLQL